MRADAQKNRERLLETARALARGDQLPTLNELARSTGFGVATVYRHFPDTEALAAALVEEPLAQLQQLFERGSAEPDPMAALRVWFIGALELELTNPLVGRLLHAPETTSESVRETLRHLQEAARQLLARARKKKLVRASVTSEDFCRLMLGVHAAAIAGPDPLVAARRYADIVLAGLAPRQGKVTGSS